MKMLKKFTLIIFISLINFTNTNASENLFEKAKKILKKKIMINRNFYFKETLYLTQKMLNLIFI